MWSLETLAQLNAKHAELGRDNQPVDHREVYAECGIRLLGDRQKLPVVQPNEPTAFGATARLLRADF